MTKNKLVEISKKKNLQLSISECHSKILDINF